MIDDLHSWIAWPFMIANGAVGVWALAAHQWPRLRCRAIWAGVVVAQALVVVQMALGVVRQIRDDILGGQHQLYGFAAFMSVGVLYAYRSEMRDRPYLLYGLGCLWLMGLGIRAMFV